MPIRVECECGKVYRVKEELAGRRFRCAKCGEAVAVPRGEEEPLEVTLAEESPRRSRRPADEEREERRPARRGITSRRDPDEEDERPARRSRLRDEEPEEEAEAERPRKKKKKKRSGGGGGGGNSTALSAILGGLGLMVGGAAWFFIGLAADRIYFYAPVVFVAGVASFAKGLMGGE